jgi:hypothetical protein
MVPRSQLNSGHPGNILVKPLEDSVMVYLAHGKEPKLELGIIVGHGRDCTPKKVHDTRVDAPQMINGAFAIHHVGIDAFGDVKLRFTLRNFLSKELEKPPRLYQFRVENMGKRSAEALTPLFVQVVSQA